ncbi:hypothetical protein [Micromonospora sp. U21]|nr:hypothetical protein [Micromonospora sp. U21]
MAEQIARQLGREAVIADSRLPLSASASAVSCAGTDRAGCKI